MKNIFFKISLYKIITRRKYHTKKKKCDHPKTNNNSLCFQQLPIGKVSYVDNALHSVMWLKEAPLQIMYSHFHQPIRNYREKLRNAAHLVGTHFIYLQNNCASDWIGISWWNQAFEVLIIWLNKVLVPLSNTRAQKSGYFNKIPT